MINNGSFDQCKKLFDKNNIVSKTNIKGIITYANDKFCELSGYTREELVWKPHNIVRHPDMSKEVFKELRDTIKIKKQTWEWIVKNKKKDGWYYWAKTIVSPVLDDEWNIVEFISIRTDITWLKDSIKLIEDYKNILDYCNLLIILDEEWTIKYVNENFCIISWYKKVELLWKKYLNLIWTNLTNNPDNIYQEVLWIIDIKEEYIYEIINIIKSKEPWKWVVKNKWKYGKKFWTSTTIMPIINYDNEIKEFYCIQTDITDIEMAKNWLKKSFDKLRELDLKKDEFLNIASHELRTPMTSVKWYISMLIDGDLWVIDETAKGYLIKIYDSTKNLINLINDMLDISKIESWKIQFFKENFELKLFLIEIINEMKSISNKKNISIIPDIEYDSLIFNSDKNKLKQIMINLIGNAIKFTSENWKIEIKSFALKWKINIIIKDNWIWISEKDMSKIFEKFGQVKNSLTRDTWWTWLGLSIVKWIVKKLDWELILKSEVWIWSEFKVIFNL